MDLRNFGQAIRELSEEKGVQEEKVVETIELAIAAAYKKDYGKKGQIIRARFNTETGDLKFSQIKIVVDESVIKTEEEIEAEETERRSASDATPQEPREKRRESEETPEDLGSEAIRKVRFNPERHIMLNEAVLIKKDAVVGEELEFSLDTKQDFGRIASQTAKQVIIQRIREAEREATYGEYKTKESEIVSGIVQRVEGRNVFIDLGRGTGILPYEEQIPRERYLVGERLKCLVLRVEKDSRGPGILLTRSHQLFLKKLFELEVPEIPSGMVEIKGMAREPSSRAKVAVMSNDSAIDPVGSMVGQRGVRVSTVINEIGGEKIDIIEWSDDAAKFIANALAPAKVLDVEIDEERREARVTVPDDQLSLAIGKGGQNVRLAAKLTGWKIDARSNKPTPTPPPEEPPAASEIKVEEASIDAGEALPISGGESESVPEGEPAIVKEVPDMPDAPPEKLGAESKEMAKAAGVEKIQGKKARSKKSEE